MILDALSLTDVLAYEVLGDDIHFVRLADYSRQHIATLTAVFQLLYATTEETETLYLLIDCAAASAAETTRVWDAIDLIRREPPQPPVVVAMLRRHPPMSMLTTILTPLRSQNQVRLFNADERDRAVGWLLSKQLEAKARLASSREYHLVDY